MKLGQRQLEGYVIFDLDGDFDSRSAGRAKDEMRSAILNGSCNLLINLEGVHYIDSAGLGTLVSILKASKENGGNVWLSGLNAQIKMVVELTRLHYVFDIYDTVEDAIEALCGGVKTEEPE